MGKRPNYRRAADDIKRGTIIAWDANADSRNQLAVRVKYKGNGTHKNYPPPKDEWIPCLRRGKSACWKFRTEDWPKIEQALRDAILVGTIADFRGEYPSRVWAYINNVLHEARLTGNGEYHGFPIEYEEQFPLDPHELLLAAHHVEIPVN